MKRTIATVMGLAILAGAYASSKLGAQAPTAPAATKIAIVNIGEVFQKYDKALFFKHEMETDLKPIRDEVGKLNDLIGQWQKALRNPQAKLTAEQRAQGEKTIVDAKRRLEDLDREARKKIGKKNEDQIVQLYKEVYQFTEAYAKNNGFNIVLGYGDLPGSDPFSFINIARKMQAMDSGAVIPFYAGAGLDISQGVLTTLNGAYRGPRAPVPATPVSQQK